MSNLQAALSYAAQGYRVFPLSPGTKKPFKGSHGFKDATSDTEQITTWWTDTPEANVGIATGEESNLLVIDLDAYKESDAPDDVTGIIAWGEGRANVELNQTLTVRTGSGGLQLWYTFPDFNARNSNSSRLGVNIDIRGNGGYTLAPGSVVDGHVYALTVDIPRAAANVNLLDRLRPSAKAAAILPTIEQPVIENESSLEHARTYAKNRAKGILQDLAALKSTGWDGPSWGETCWAKARDLVRLGRTEWTGLPLDTLHNAYVKVVEQLRDGTEDWDRRLVGYWESALEHVDDYEPIPASAKVDLYFSEEQGEEVERPAAQMFSWDDFGMADRLSHYSSGRCLWLFDTGSWAVYSQSEWKLQNELAERQMREVTENMIEWEAEFYSDEVPEGAKESPREQFAKWARSRRTVKSVKSSLEMSKSKKGITQSINDFDADPMLFQVGNGVIDLRTIEVSPKSQSLKILKGTDVMYDPAATCPMWLAHLKRVLPNPEDQEFLQRWVGYCLTGLQTEQRFAIHFGPPGTGKSVFLDVMGHLFGNYHVSANADVLHDTASEQHMTGLASLAGSRFIQASESKKGRKLNSATVNMLTSQEKVTARFMRQDEFNFSPTGKINYVTNHKPKIDPTAGTWRRMILVGWNEIISESEKRKDLGQLIIENELSGVLNWALQGCLEWQKRKSLDVPMHMELEKDEYKAEEDVLGAFIADSCIIDADARTTTDDLFIAYRRWREINGFMLNGTKITLAKDLKEAGWKPYRTSSERGFEGLRVREDATGPKYPNSPAQPEYDKSLDSLLDI